jgi:hypothetical protein
LTNRTRKTVNLIVKLSIVLLAAIFIFKELNNNNNLRNFESLLKSIPPAKAYIILGIVGVLMFVNWFLEALKWKFLLSDIQPISYRKAIESVFCGLTLAIFTPNRLGEYGGRVFFLHPRKRVFGAIAMGVGAVGQMVVTNILGATAILWFIALYLHPNKWTFFGLIFLVLAYCLFFILLFFKIGILLKVLSRFRFLNGFKKFFTVLSKYRNQELYTVFIYCLLRFIVFTSQYCLIIKLLIPEIHEVEMLMMILIFFFIQSALPSLDLLDVGVRTMTATYLFGFITTNDIAIMASTASIWFINIIIPAILGSVFVFKLNIFGTKRN